MQYQGRHFNTKIYCFKSIGPLKKDSFHLKFWPMPGLHVCIDLHHGSSLDANE